ncbi:MAG: hypothetical protein WCL27_10225 [Betaproteobacteria bacterium]
MTTTPVSLSEPVAVADDWCHSSVIMSAPHPLFNPDAGQHPLPVDEREIEAVLRSTLRCYEQHPYFFARYGKRGEAFTRSDGGYLATLADYPQSHVDSQVAWLARMLVSRGLPRWLMEVHLGLLAEELVVAVPERAASYAKLQHAACVLREERQAQIAQSDFDTLVADFENAAGAGLEGAGGLLVAAVCDECCGLREAVPALLVWFGDPGRFSLRWCASVAATLEQARALSIRSQT